ncbi:MAG: DoxX family protein [Gammaproteobacteria bacterium]|nr:MAG: DoxX family protein [Gammaproteobacteria bacterium]
MVNKFTEFGGRILLGHIFLLAGISKITAYDGTMGYMDAMGVPGMLLPAVILLEIAGGLMVIAGFKTRIAAAALAGFSIIAAVIFHSDLADQMQMILFMKNLSIAGGLLLLVSYGAGSISIDKKLG